MSGSWANVSAPSIRTRSASAVRRSRRRRSAIALPWPAIAIFLVAVVVGIVISLAVIPQATVKIVPAWEPLEEIIEVRGEPTLSTADPRRMMVPVRTCQTEVKASASVPASGRKVMMNAKAEGWVTLINRTDSPLTIPRETLLYAVKGQKFETTEDKTIAGNGGVVRVWVVAKEPGVESNVHRNEIVRIDGDLARTVSVINEDDITGGGLRETLVATLDDRERVKQNLVASLEEEAKNKLWQDPARRANDEFLAGSVTLVPIREEYVQREGDQAGSVILFIQARAVGIAVNVAEIVSLAERSWQPRLNSGYNLSPTSVRISKPQIKQIDPSNGSATIIVKATGSAIARLDRHKLENELRWKTPREMARYLAQTQSLGELPIINIEPEWASRAMRVSVTLIDPVMAIGN